MANKISKFTLTIFGDGRWKLLAKGLKFVIIVTIMATIIGLILGVVLAFFNLSDDFLEGPKLKLLKKFNVLKWFSSVYLFIIRGTPVLVQLFLLKLVVFTGSLKGVDIMIIAGIGFGLNSAAYVAEIVRSGIKSIDKGQLEAARALGMPYKMGMWLVILPQAFKNMLPTFVNEFIVLLKETSVVGFIGGFDLFKAAEGISAITYDGISPLVAIAFIYLVLTTIFTFIMTFVERSMSKSDV